MESACFVWREDWLLLFSSEIIMEMIIIYVMFKQITPFTVLFILINISLQSDFDQTWLIRERSAKTHKSHLPLLVLPNTLWP